jgi:hypothetical protein
VLSNISHLTKALGLDDFNTDFVKRCWPIICNEFYQFCNAFYSGGVCLHNLNGSHITLIPKHDNAVKVLDFKPIRLLNTSIKVMTKLLANRLQRAMPRLIHKNQYGFLKARTILRLFSLVFGIPTPLSSVKE